MAEVSAGLLVYRRAAGSLQFLLAHPGGPFWARRDDGAWTIPKGLVGGNEEPHAAALREFKEETGLDLQGSFAALAPLKQKSGKTVFCWLVEADPDLGAFASNLFEMEWPPRSGRRASFPEIDRIAWFAPDEALAKILAGQAGFIREALERLGAPAQGAQPSPPFRP
jgi:predicted NUDIX family NTP pyrophosphohydrolase